MTTGQLIKELRLKKGMTQEELAAKTDISVRTIQRIENGEVDPRAYTLQNIAAALDVDFEELNNSGKIDSAPKSPKENEMWLAVLHLSGLPILLIPSILIWLWKKDTVKNIREHAVDVVNFQLSMLIYLIPCGMLAMFIITIPILILLGIFWPAVIIMNTIKVINKQSYKYPLSIHILKP